MCLLTQTELTFKKWRVLNCNLTFVVILWCILLVFWRYFLISPVRESYQDMEDMEVDQENNNEATLRNSFHRKSRYRDLLNKVEKIQDSGDVGVQTVKDLHEVFEAVNSLEAQCDISARVAHVDQTLADSVILSSASSILVKCIESVNSLNATYEATEFANKITDRIKTQPDRIRPNDWIALLQNARSVVQEIPCYSFTYGAFDPAKLPQPKEKKQRTREAPEKLQKKQLEKISNADKDEEGIDDIVNFLSRVLEEEFIRNGNRPISYWKYVIDTDSFTTTVENIFYCSFLLRNGKARMDVDENRDPVIQPMSGKQLKAFRANNGQNTQMITSIRMEDWQKFDIDEGFLQHHRKRK